MKRVIFISLAALATMGCRETPEDPESVCGDGIAQADEDSSTCCVDVGCDDGICDEDSMACVDPSTFCGDGVAQDWEDSNTCCQDVGCGGGFCDPDTGECVEEPDLCGDGEVQDGEDEETCCIDVGCDEGVCDTESYACVDPWVLVCPERTGECADAAPWVCDDDGPPSYSCQECGCPTGQSCYEDVCYDDGFSSLERFNYGPAEDLSLDEYFSFVDTLSAEPALTYAELVETLDALLREDSRRSTLLIGESHSSDDEQAVGLQLIRDVVDLGWDVTEIGVENSESPILDLEPIRDLSISEAGIDGDLTNDAYCDDALDQTQELLNTEGLYVQYTGSGHTSREICHHAEHWGICDPPHTAECLLAEGRLSVTVILFDPVPWFVGTDRVLLWSLGDLYASGIEEVKSQLQVFVDRWATSFASQVADPDFDVEVNGRPVNVRVVQAQHAEDVFIAFFPRPDRPPYFLQSFQTILDDAELAGVLFDHDIQPGYCSIGWEGDPETGLLINLFWYCEDGGHGFDATLDAETFEITSRTVLTP